VSIEISTEAWGALSDEARWTAQRVGLRLHAGFTQAEIARELGVPAHEVRRRLRRLKAELQRGERRCQNPDCPNVIDPARRGHCRTCSDNCRKALNRVTVRAEAA